MFTDMLIPYDGSKPATKALATAVEWGTALQPQAVNITLLHVLRMTDDERTSLDVASAMAGLATLNDDDLDVDEQRKQRIQEYFESFPDNIDLQIVIKRGNPRDVICQYASENDIDCIVMGRRGIGGIRGTLGSVSASVLRGTDLPVLVVA